MTIVLLLAPFSLALALTGLAAFWWSLKSGQYEDPKGDAARILYDHLEDGPGD
ncbi:MAG: cbb3-type cytochrome oxidase assembly protein CcoS [Caulobacter sp.]|nr:cbb3-type cytochrome oxidase assembly protein CcoS [Caulobacter sp.]